MIQLYFLSIVLNGLAGFLLVMGETGTGLSIENSIKFSPAGSTVRLLLGIAAGIIGILKLLLPLKGIPVLGDLVPALAGIAAGFILVFGFYREHASSGDIDDDEKLNHIGDAFLRYKKIAGVLLIAVALLHFLFAEALFL